MAADLIRIRMEELYEGPIESRPSLFTIPGGIEIKIPHPSVLLKFTQLDCRLHPPLSAPDQYRGLPPGNGTPDLGTCDLQAINIRTGRRTHTHTFLCGNLPYAPTNAICHLLRNRAIINFYYLAELENCSI